MKEFKDKFMTQAKFSTMVEDVVKNSNGLVNYIDAVIVVCDELEIEVDTVNKLISKPLKDKIKFNAQQLNFVKRTSRGVLPI
jgi:hypothetical protein|tara:strand:- start:19135 stop:19380 length:246 start_codon:yes stop_codon:yes gene_type:complete